MIEEKSFGKSLSTNGRGDSERRSSSDGFSINSKEMHLFLAKK